MFLEFEKVGPARGTDAFEKQVEEIYGVLLDAFNCGVTIADAIVLYCLDPLVSLEAINEAQEQFNQRKAQ